MNAYSMQQLELIQRPVAQSIFLEGPAGAGKTTVGVGRLLHLLSQRVPASSILVVTPQRTLAAPYAAALNDVGIVPGGVASLVTIGGLAQHMVNLFWPVAAARAGFSHPDQPPTYLTLETAQYYMSRLVRPLLDQGYFSQVTISRNRLYSQILDNLNKAALVGFSYTQIGQRLKAAWMGNPKEAQSQLHIYDDAQDCAQRFRQYCLENNLLDFSLQLEVFLQVLWPDPLCRNFLRQQYHHLLVDNIEEDTPVAHDLLREWLPDFDSALIIYDQDAGYRRFLGADPASGYALKDLCTESFALVDSFSTSPALQSFSASLGRALSVSRPASGITTPAMGFQENLVFGVQRYYPQMIDWVAEQVADLVQHQAVPPGEIAILAPFMPDVLRFSLANRLERYGIPCRSHRPSRTLNEEPAMRCLLTLAALAHPQWGILPSKFDVTYALMQAIQGLDLVRAQLLVEIVYRTKEALPALESFMGIRPEIQARITFACGEHYEGLCTWLHQYAANPEEYLDVFLSRLFGEVLSQRGYGFFRNYAAGEVAANLVESARKFRWEIGATVATSVGREYLQTVQEGILAAQYMRSWQNQPTASVLIAPAYTFLLYNQPVDYQFWLDIGSRGWYERLYQPLTQPYVLSREWEEDQPWTSEDDFIVSQENLYHLAAGLIRRCRKKIYFGLSRLNEQGNDQKGELLKALQKVLKEQTHV